MQTHRRTNGKLDCRGKSSISVGIGLDCDLATRTLCWITNSRSSEWDSIVLSHIQETEGFFRFWLKPYQSVQILASSLVHRG